MPKQHSGAAALAAALFICALGGAAVRVAHAAAQFSIEPLLLKLPADKLAAPLKIGNAGTKPVTVQTELVSWSQDGGTDVYAPAAGLVASPPIFKLPVGGQQVVRVGRLAKEQPPAREVAYRIRITEVVTQPSESENVSTYMQVTLPIFVPPADKNAKPALALKQVEQVGNSLRLTLANAGAVHDKVTGLVLSQGGKTFAEKGHNFYVLAGAQRDLAWPDAAAGRSGPVELEVRLQGKHRTLKQVLTLAPVDAPPPAAAPAAAPPPQASEPKR